MNILNAIILGIVQGLTEFLPVSSSGHLVLLQKIFGITTPALFFDTMLHAGTLLAVFAVLRQDILEILKKLVQPLTAFLILATIPAVIAALVFGDFIEHTFETGRFLGISFLATSAILVTAERLSRRADNFTGKSAGNEKRKNLTWRDALIIGTMQAIAIIPGISRSGATISGALSRKLDRDFAARFSFLLSIPVILGAVLLQTKDLVKSGAAETAGESIGAAAVIAGTASAAITGYFAVKLMLKIVREKSLYGFAIYTGILGILVLLDQFVIHLIF
jgi:undecaprenyl-diphosphatase